MKKMQMLSVVLIVLVMLLLSACVPGQTMDTDPTEDPSENVLGSLLNDAVYAVPLSSSTYIQVHKLGENVLLLGEDSSMTLLSCSTYQTLATVQIPGEFQDLSLSVTDEGVWYYSKGTNEVVCLNQQLLETRRVKLPEGIWGEPALYAGGREVFYCLGTEIRAMDVRTGVARLVKEFTNTMFGLNGVYFNGAILSCKVSIHGEVSEDSALDSTCFISADDGSFLEEYGNVFASDSFFSLRTFGERYYLSRMDGVVYQAIYGDRSTEEAVLVNVLSLERKFAPLLELGGLLHQDKESNLLLYDMKTGAIKAETSFADAGTLDAFLGDEENQCVWFLSTDEQGQKTLCRWNYEKSPSISNLQIPVGKLYTNKDPDTEGLKACQEAADAIYEKYGVRVDFWQEAVKATGTYTLIPEYQPTAILKRMERIEAVLTQFPESIVKKLVTDDELHISIVRSIDNSGKIVQYWQDGVAYIAVSVYADIEKHLLLEIFRVMDVYVIGNSQQYDDWSQLNPSDFAYGMQDSKYLEHGSMAFVDGMSMNSPVEDRIRILVAAMQPDNGELFQNPILRSKLQHISDAIRVAYDLEKYPQMLPWEQYLA